MISLHPEQCLLCQSVRYDEMMSFTVPDVYEQALGVISDGYARQWGRCKDCGFIYARYSRAEGLIDEIYQTIYRDENVSWRTGTPQQVFEKISQLPESQSETKFRTKWIKARIKELEQDGVLEKSEGIRQFLDIGGGNGVLAHEFQDSEWQVHVVDPDENGKFIQDKFNISFIADYYRPNLFSKKFDLISLVFVLEHILHPVRLLKDIRQDMEQGSLLYVEVPDAICFNVKDATDDIFNSCHLWMFSPNTLTRLFDICGFELFVLNRIKTKRGHMALMILAGSK